MTIMRSRFLVALFGIALLALVTPGPAAIAANGPSPRTVALEEFLRLAVRNDTEFEQILIDELKLAYRKDLLLPAGDLVASVKGQYDFFLDQDRSDPELTFSLSKLFRYSGTELSLSYSNTPTSDLPVSGSELEFLVSQPIAGNAFGRATRLQGKIIGIENDVIGYQIVEAYEDYLASLMAIFYDWYSAWENLNIGEASYKSNQKLLDNIYARQKQKIALPIDVNKVELLVLGKQENLVSLGEVYANLTNLVKKAIRDDSGREIVPGDPSGARPAEVVFERDYNRFTGSSRTYDMLNLLERQSSLEVKRAADDLLPSTRLLLGYKLRGDDWGIRDGERMAYAGIAIDWPLPDRVDRAAHKIARVEHRKTVLSNQNKYLELRTNLKNLYQRIEREKKLIDISARKIKLSEAVLRDEAENYSFGKVTLNDYIDAVNRLDENRFDRIQRTVQLQKLMVEWSRLTDRLVDKSVLRQQD
jgi:outer membrane protein TolC